MKNNQKNSRYLKQKIRKYSNIIIEIEDIKLKNKSENLDIKIKDENTTSTSIDEDFSNEIKTIKSIFSKKNKSKYDKETINNFVKKIPSEINNYNLENKINLILDLDNTLIYSVPYLNLPKDTFIPDKTFRKALKIEDLETIRFSNSEVYIYRFRDGLNLFFQNTKNFCNYYIYTTAIKTYAEQVIEKIKSKFKIEIKGIMANNKIEKKDIIKSLNKINLNSKNTIIIDDSPKLWPENLSNLLLSKKFCDFKIMNLLNKNYFNDLGNYTILKENINGKINLNSYVKQFNINKNKNFFPYNVESNDFSERKQLNYLFIFIQKIHYLYFHFNISVPLAIKILKMNIFYNKYFVISKYFVNYDELIEMIIYCGGTIINCHSLSNLIFVEKENKKIEGKIIVSEEYIYDCYFMLHYFNENEEYYHFRNIIEINE